MDYYIKVNIVLALIYCFYYLALRRSAYFSANRAFLLSGLALSFTLPALQIGTVPAMFSGFGERVLTFSEPAPQVASSPGGNATLPGTMLDPVTIEAGGAGLASSTAWEWIVIVYACIAVTILLRIVYFLYQLLFLYRSCQVVKQKRYRLVLLESPHAAAFSFFSTIFISAADLRQKDNWILRHELVHVKQLHSLDILLSEIVKALFWINPFAHLYQRALRSVNEYAADSIVPQHARDHYAKLMYDYAFFNDTRGLQNRFFNKTLLKRRITMLYQKKTLKMKTRYLLIIPMLTLLLAFTAKSPKTPGPASAAIPPPAGSQAEGSTVRSLIRVTGTVSDVKNQAIGGVSVFVEGTPAGTATDLNGRFQLADIPSNARLRFSMIGYEPQTVSLGNNNTVNIRLRRKREMLDSMVLVTYPSINETELPADKTSPEKTSEEARETSGKKDKPVYSFASLEQMPVFPGGKEELIAYIARHFNYPAEAKKNKVEGIVEVGFVVDEKGNIRQAEILKGIGSGCDEEALQVIKSLPTWQPGEQNGVKVAVYYVIPLKLRADVRG